jgi:LETM1-like protein
VFQAKAKTFWIHTKEELYHYWLGSKLLWQEMKTSTNLVRRKLSGHTLTRRERQQLLKTSADMFRLVCTPCGVWIRLNTLEMMSLSRSLAGAVCRVCHCPIHGTVAPNHFKAVSQHASKYL